MAPAGAEAISRVQSGRLAWYRNGDAGMGDGSEWGLLEEPRLREDRKQTSADIGAVLSFKSF
jgi:hypothetical protein